jgi:hypothetical protein
MPPGLRGPAAARPGVAAQGVTSPGAADTPGSQGQPGLQGGVGKDPLQSIYSGRYFAALYLRALADRAGRGAQSLPAKCK